MTEEENVATIWLVKTNQKGGANVVKVKTLDERAVYDIGHAFGYYDYGDEHGMNTIFSSQEAISIYIQGYVRWAFRGGFLHATSERGEGYIAYKQAGQKSGIWAAMPLLKAVFQAMTLKEVINFIRVMSHGEKSPTDKLDKEKKPYIFVGMVCVREQYQGQGYMRKVMDMAFEEGNRLQVPVILDTDAKTKCDKYMHLGMKLAGIRDFGEYGKLYDLIKYPDKKN